MSTARGLMPTSTPPTDWVSRWGGATGGFQQAMLAYQRPFRFRMVTSWGTPSAVNVSSAHCPDKAAGCAVSVVADDGDA